MNVTATSHAPLGAGASFDFGPPGTPAGFRLPGDIRSPHDVYIGCRAAPADAWSLLPFYTPRADVPSPLAKGRFGRFLAVAGDKWMIGPLVFKLCTPFALDRQADDEIFRYAPVVCGYLEYDNSHGEHTAEFPEVDQAPVAAIAEDLLELLVVPGPRDDWFVDPDALVHTEWVVTDHSDRVGMRLAGRPLQHRWPDRQLSSEGTTRGAIQVPHNGLPVILGPDHPVTGGYPVIGVVADDDIDRVAQIRPGQTVRMHWSRPRHPFEGNA